MVSLRFLSRISPGPLCRRPLTKGFGEIRLGRACAAAAACLGAATGLAGCAQLEYASLSGHQVPGVAATVHIVDSPETVGAFQPAIVHVQAGQTVAWVNASGDYHTVTFDDQSVPSSPGFGPGGTFQRTFPKPGTYRYLCLYHQGMVGEVVVGGQAASAART